MIDQTKKEVFKAELKDMLSEDEDLSKGLSDKEIIYQIDDISVYGGFYDGIRSIDHNILLFPNIEWEDILKYGTLAVPETKTYISEEKVQKFENLGYQRTPLDNNHIIKETRKENFVSSDDIQSKLKNFADNHEVVIPKQEDNNLKLH